MPTSPRPKLEVALGLALTTLALAAGAGAAPPTLILDQQQPLIDAAENTLAVGGPSEQKLAQTFMVGVAGRLAEVRLPIGCADGLLVVEIQGVTATGEPDGVALVRKSIGAHSLPGVVPATFESIRLPRRLSVAPGDQLAIVLTNETGSCGVAASPDGDTYADGQGWFDARPNPPGWLPFFPLSPEDDMPFQTVVFGSAP